MVGMSQLDAVQYKKNCKFGSKYSFCGSSIAPFHMALFFFFFFVTVGSYFSGSSYWMLSGALCAVMGASGGSKWVMSLSKEMSFKSVMEGPTVKDGMGLKLGFALFILSEVFFFFAGFWGWVNMGVGEISRGCMWPPAEVDPVNPLGAPLLGSITLLSSGALVSTAYKVLKKKGPAGKDKSTYLLWGACGMGILFLLIQKEEMSSMNMSLGDSSYSSLFYFLTVLHGTHVWFGVMFMSCVSVMNRTPLKKVNLYLEAPSESRYQPVPQTCVEECWLGTKLSMWYWHFVDVVWLFVFSLVYVWSYLNRVWE
nr:COX3 [Donax semistriatus]